MGNMLRTLAFASAVAVTAVPVSAATVIWNPSSTDTGVSTDFDTATQTFSGINADSITFNGSGFFHNHGGGAGFNIFAIINGTSQTIFSYAPGSPTSFYDLSSLGPISFGGGQVTGISISSTSYVGNAFHSFGDESFDLNLVGSVPEPGTWAMMLLGFGAIGFAMRRRNPAHATISQIA